MFTGIRRSGRSVNVWPGYVDALAALLMVVIFVLLIFTMAQFLLRQVVSEQETELDSLHENMATLIEQLGLQTERAEGLEGEMGRLSDVLAVLTSEKAALSGLVDEQKAALESERQLSAQAQSQIALLNHRIVELSEQLQIIGQALKLAETQKRAQAEQIEDLGKRLNIELARRLNELQHYRSEFFGKVREALGDNPDLRVEGDRFVFQSELLFGSGSAELGAAGKAQLARLARTLLELGSRIPDNVDWILRVDGHTDKVPLTGGGAFSSNWELSNARALSVVQHLAAQGIPSRRMAAAGFGEYRPIDPGEGVEANRKNRRIEIKLTTP